MLLEVYIYLEKLYVNENLENVKGEKFEGNKKGRGLRPSPKALMEG
jgi:hypothetical protein